jgi:hypothetical protein
MGGNKLGTQLATYTPCTLHGSLTAVHHGQDILITNCMLPFIHAGLCVIDDL